ncbi:MAG TPA: tRNA uridine-5-carboxymethylaminomethyl(34) synthesis GTPase MnmE [Spongiibacteraceae bacterium]
MTGLHTDTIAAIATPAGRGGVGIVRVSGPLARAIMVNVIGKTLTPRVAHYGPFLESRDGDAQVLDQGIALFFAAPYSFTGEDVLELQGHGGSIILDCLLRATIRLGARLARPGEFSERAFLNDKMDLAQAEAIADLIDSSSEQAARSALRSLQGEFSRRIDALIEQLTQLRMYVEAAIDFPEEEIDFLGDGKIARDIENLLGTLAAIIDNATQGSLMREGMTIVIAGAPNAGKSSLLNALAGADRAIVTPIAGTTRDVLREHIQIDGLPLHIIDTAGLRESPDEIEREGIRRAWQEIERADHVLLVTDSSADAIDPQSLWPIGAPVALAQKPMTLIRNKCDLSQLPPTLVTGAPNQVTLSAKTGAGIELLRQHLQTCVGFCGNAEGIFLARRRHLDALNRARELLLRGQEELLARNAGELLAEDLRLCQQTLGEITGAVSADALLGRIFSSFCIGK